jgi:hypothetical protein
MANTTNFGWETPDDTDLVKDGAAAIRTVAGAIDTSLVDLKGGTTGQVLSKATGTDMDFTWVALDDSNAIQNAIVDAKGDLISATAADTPARLAVGTNNQVLTADSTTATGLKWATPAAVGGMTLLSTTTLSGSSTTISSISGDYINLLILVYGITGPSGGELRLNGSTTGFYATKTFSEVSSGYVQGISNLTPRWNEGGGVNGANTVALLISNYASTDATKVVQNTGGFLNSTTGYTFNQFGFFNSTSAISSLTVSADSGSFSAGTVKIYGVK